MSRKDWSRRWETITNAEDKNKVEALLFSSGGGIRLDSIMEITGLGKDQVTALIDELVAQYKERDSPIIILPEGERFKMTIKERYLSVVHSINPNTELSKQVLETLAVVAWKQPILQSEVINIRTSSAYEHIAELVDKGFVTREHSGRSFLLKLTGKFFEYFDLPNNGQVRELFKAVDGQGELQSHVVEFDGEHLGPLEVYDSKTNAQGGPQLETYSEDQQSAANMHPEGTDLDTLASGSPGQAPAAKRKWGSEEPNDGRRPAQDASSPRHDTPTLQEPKSVKEALADFTPPPRDEFRTVAKKEDVRADGNVEMTFTGNITNKSGADRGSPGSYSGPGPMGVETPETRKTKDLVGESDVPDIVGEDESAVEHEEVNRRVNEILNEADDEKLLKKFDEEFEFAGDRDRISIGPYPVEQARYEIEGVQLNKRESKLLKELTERKDLSFLSTDEEEKPEDEDEDETLMDEASEIERKERQIASGIGSPKKG